MINHVEDVTGVVECRDRVVDEGRVEKSIVG